MCIFIVFYRYLHRLFRQWRSNKQSICKIHILESHKWQRVLTYTLCTQNLDGIVGIYLQICFVRFYPHPTAKMHCSYSIHKMLADSLGDLASPEHMLLLIFFTSKIHRNNMVYSSQCTLLCWCCFLQKSERFSRGVKTNSKPTNHCGFPHEDAWAFTRRQCPIFISITWQSLFAFFLTVMDSGEGRTIPIVGNQCKWLPRSAVLFHLNWHCDRSVGMHFSDNVTDDKDAKKAIWTSISVNDYVKNSAFCSFSTQQSCSL